MANFYDAVLEVLKQDQRFFAEDGTFLRNAVYEAAMQMDTELIKLLMGNEETKKRFFTEVDGIYVFDKTQFGWVVNNRQFLPDSYTRFKNKVGLVDDSGDLISNSGNVELVFPYKDCVLEGGQTKEDQKRSEVFYNETLAPDEIDRLLYPKVLTDAHRITYAGDLDDEGKPTGKNAQISTEVAQEISETDNLIIKGNNLLALSSMLKRYEGRIKCIYIDPPYYFTVKKDEDTFDYNSNFKLSTWLVFMKNRLELAYKLLRPDGAIFVQISDDGVAELHRLMKEIFCRGDENNFINKITVKTKSPSGFASVNPGVFETAEYILAFAKNKKLWTYNTQYVKAEYDTNYKWLIKNKEADPNEWEVVDIFDWVATEKGYSDKKAAKKELGDILFNMLVGEYALENADNVYRYTAIGDNAGQEVVRIRDLSKENKDETFVVERDNQYTVYIRNGQEIAFYSKKIREIDGEMVPSMQLTNIWTDTPYEGIAKEGDVKLKGGKKPEKLIRRIIEMSTDPGDIVMDYHVGSGTTAAVAHKLGRQYIGVEQLQEQIDKTMHRLSEVIKGEQSGISKAVGWKGGGSFLYCELAKLNQSLVEKIQKSESTEELKDLFREIIESNYISHKVNPSTICAEADSYQSLAMEDQKKFLMELLDKNLLYVNYCDIDDEEFQISEADKAFSKSFYGEE